MAAQGIDNLVSLPVRKLTHAKHHSCTLDSLTLHRNEAHRRPQGRFAERLRIGATLFWRLTNGLTQAEESHVMTQLADLTAQK